MLCAPYCSARAKQKAFRKTQKNSNIGMCRGAGWMGRAAAQGRGNPGNGTAPESGSIRERFSREMNSMHLPLPWFPRTSILAVALFGGALFAYAEEPAPPPSDPVEPAARDRDFSWMPKAEWEKLHAEFSAVAAKGEAKLVFHGDSLLGAARWSEAWKQEFGRYEPALFGMGGDRTQNLLWRLENGEIGSLTPKVVVLLIGTNNIHTTPRDVEDTARGIIACAQKLNAAYPAAKILVLGVFPRDEDPQSAIRAKIKRINELVAAIDDGERFFVRDIGAVFLEPDGRLSREISPDQLHLKEEGLRRWAEAIAPFIHENMK